jgi:hypothetical protein
VISRQDRLIKIKNLTGHQLMFDLDKLGDRKDLIELCLQIKEAFIWSMRLSLTKMEVFRRLIQPLKTPEEWIKRKKFLTDDPFWKTNDILPFEACLLRVQISGS